MTRSSLDINRVTTALQQAEQHGQALEQGWAQTWSVGRLARAWWTREYKTVPWRSLGLGLFAVLYLLNPLDLIPDPIPFLGVLDDATMFGFVLASLRADVKLFERWEGRALPDPDADVIDVDPA